MTKEEIERALKNPPYSIAIGNLYSKAFDFREAAKRYLRQLTEFGYLEAHGCNKNRRYSKHRDLAYNSPGPAFF